MYLATGLCTLNMHHKRSWVVSAKPFQELLSLSIVVASAMVEFLSSGRRKKGEEGEERGWVSVVSLHFGLGPFSPYLVACAQKIVEIRLHPLP